MSLRLLALAIPAAALIALTACGPTLCDEGEVAAVRLTIETSDGGTPSNVSATYDAEDGTSGPCEQVGSAWECAIEKEGIIEVTVSADGYATATGSTEVTADECHVDQESLTITLSPG